MSSNALSEMSASLTPRSTIISISLCAPQYSGTTRPENKLQSTTAIYIGNAAIEHDAVCRVVIRSKERREFLQRTESDEVQWFQMPS